MPCWLAGVNFPETYLSLKEIQIRMSPFGVEGDLIPQFLVEIFCPEIKQIILVYIGSKEFIL
jgi:hypothetical protein